MRIRNGSFWVSVVLAFLFAPFYLLSAQAAASPSAKLKISGYGLIGDLQLRRSVILLETGGAKRQFFDANHVEDAVAIITSRLSQDGYLHPEITAEMLLTDGHALTFSWRGTMDQTVPRPLLVSKLHFKIHRGVRYYFKDLRFEGLTSVDLKTARSYFIQTSLIPLKAYRIYSPLLLKRGISSLTDVLERQGFRNVEAVATDLKQDDRTGEVSLIIKVSQGPKSIVRTVREEIIRSNRPPAEFTFRSDAVYSQIWEQDFVNTIKTNYYHLGYPDTAVVLTATNHPVQTNMVSVDVQASVTPGDLVYAGKVKFEGEKKTRLSVMRERVKIQPGQLLDLTEVDHARYRLSQLGIFDSVGVRYDQVSPDTRDVIYEVKESRQLEISLFFGFGTYELLRGGVEIDQHNIFGLAHSARLRASQSFKTTAADYTYTIPELLGEDVNTFIDASALQRQELSFLREEYGGGFGSEKYFRQIQSDISIRYDLRLLDASQTEFSPQYGLKRTTAGAAIFDIRHDRRDHPLYPHHGYKVFANLEAASHALGGEVNYERFDLSTSYHFPIGPSQWLHLGIDHGAVFTGRGPQYDLPFGRRFFPGGENSIRGYTQGEAAPRDNHGNLIGAESYMLGSIEIEQALTPKLSFVAFVDSVGLATSIDQYPFSQVLTSVGAGLSWKTLIGPVRLEYGYNIDPPLHAPTGTIQFSVGFPF